MIIVTGGAGFIGSAVVEALNNRGITDIVIVDRLGTGEKWLNLVTLQYKEFINKNNFLELLESEAFGSSIDAILHLGACSSTTEHDADYLMENNVHYTMRLGKWWSKHSNVRFIYASSAATYGNGEKGYSDDPQLINKLHPLNMYGYSKHLFDLYALREGWLERIVGLKYFNVFGPNEYHKGDMRSIICKAYPGVRDNGVMSLFKSYRSDYQDGGQLRDFIYVKDAVEMTLFFMDNQSIGGIYNIGTGRARSWNDLAKAIFAAAGKQPRIEYIPMPLNLQEKYQYYTEANLEKIKAAGCKHVCMSLEDAVKDYVRYLSSGKHLGEL